MKEIQNNERDRSIQQARVGGQSEASPLFQTVGDKLPQPQQERIPTLSEDDEAEHWDKTLREFTESSEGRERVLKRMGLGINLREARRERRLSRHQLVSSLKVDPQHLFLLEGGLLSPHEIPNYQDLVEKVAHELGVDLSEEINPEVVAKSLEVDIDALEPFDGQYGDIIPSEDGHQ